MGIPEKPDDHVQMDGGLVEPEGGKKWVIAGIQFRSPLKPIFTTTSTPVEKNLRKEEDDHGDKEEEEEEEHCSASTTPTAEESRIPSILTCPPAPRKRRRPTSRCNFNGVREFFITPPDLESVFIRLERA